MMMSKIGAIASSPNELVLYKAGDPQGDWVLGIGIGTITFTVDYVNLHAVGWTRVKDDKDVSDTMSITKVALPLKSSYSKLKIDATIASNTTGINAGRLNIIIGGNVISIISESHARQTYSVDLPALQSGDVKIEAYSGSGAGCLVDVYVYKAWLE